MTRETHQTRDLFFFFLLLQAGPRLGDHVHPQHPATCESKKTQSPCTCPCPASSTTTTTTTTARPDRPRSSIRRSRGRFETRSGVRVAAITGPCLPARDRSLSLCPRRTAGEISTQFLMAQAQPVRPLKSPFPQQQQQQQMNVNEILPVEGLLHNKPSSPHQWNSETASFERWEPARPDPRPRPTTTHTPGPVSHPIQVTKASRPCVSHPLVTHRNAS